MSPRAYQDTELTVRAGKSPQALTDIFQTLSSAGVNLLAYCSYHDRDEIVILLVTDKPHAAACAITEKGYPCARNSVVVVGASDQVGAVARLGAQLATAGIGIVYSYAYSAKREEFFAVFKTDNDDAAVSLLERLTTDHAA